MFTWFGKRNDPPMNRRVDGFSGTSITAKVKYPVRALILPGILVALIAAFPTWVFGTEPEPASSSGKRRSTSAIWAELLEKTPYPHTAPLPDAVPTALDGTYTRFDPKKAPPVPCRRCPDYVPQGGIWKLNLEKGMFRIFHEPTGWRSIGSFVIEGDRVRFFNDPCCMEAKGNYRWTLIQGRLNLMVIEDKCAIGQRAKNLTKLPWLPCQPLPALSGNSEGSPPGCE
jgi:hypothetical protein